MFVLLTGFEDDHGYSNRSIIVGVTQSLVEIAKATGVLDDGDWDGPSLLFRENGCRRYPPDGCMERWTNHVWEKWSQDRALVLPCGRGMFGSVMPVIRVSGLRAIWDNVEDIVGAYNVTLRREAFLANQGSLGKCMQM